MIDGVADPPPPPPQPPANRTIASTAPALANIRPDWIPVIDHSSAAARQPPPHRKASRL